AGGAAAAAPIDLGAAIARIAAGIGSDGVEQLDLLAGSPDLDAEDGLAAAAEIIAAPRRARGRPAGATNKRNAAVFDYLEALGHRDPAVTLSLIQSADIAALAKHLCCKRAEAARLVLDAARA